MLPEALECLVAQAAASTPPAEVFTGAQHAVHVKYHARDGLGADSVPVVLFQPVCTKDEDVILVVTGHSNGLPDLLVAGLGGVGTCSCVL